MPWALIGAACLGMFAATSSGTTRAPFLIEMAHDLGVSMPLVANLVSLTATAWGVSPRPSAARLSDGPAGVAGRWRCSGWRWRMVGQAMAGNFFWVAVWATVGGGCSGAFTGVVYAELSGRVEDRQRGRALGWVMSGQSLTLLVGVPMAAAVGSLIGWRGWLLCVGGAVAGRRRQHVHHRRVAARPAMARGVRPSISALSQRVIGLLATGIASASATASPSSTSPPSCRRPMACRWPSSPCRSRSSPSATSPAPCWAARSPTACAIG